jgi:protoporphyrinogen oxidase
MRHVIIGGGLAGLYQARILERYGYRNITIIESSNRVGGRVKSSRYYNTSYENGASKILPKHKLMLELVHELDLDHNLKEIKNPIVFKGLKVGRSRSNLNNISLQDFLNDVDMITAVRKMGYDHILKGSALYGLKYLDDLSTSSFFVIKGGLELIIARLKMQLKFTKIKLDTPVVDISTKKKVVNDEYIYDKLYIAIPPVSLNKINIDDRNNIQNKINKSILTVPLVRVYGKGDTREPHPYSVVPGPVQRQGTIYKSLHQVIYASDDNALHWKNKSNDYIASHVNIDVKPRSIEKYYWESGIHLQKPGTPILNRELYNMSVYLIGEPYYPYKRWMESALLSVIRY